MKDESVESCVCFDSMFSVAMPDALSPTQSITCPIPAGSVGEVGNTSTTYSTFLNRIFPLP